MTWMSEWLDSIQSSQTFLLGPPGNQNRRLFHGTAQRLFWKEGYAWRDRARGTTSVDRRV